MGQLERTVLLSIMDAKWKDHLYMMDALRDGIGLRADGPRDPVVEYQRGAHRMFQEMTAAIKIDAVTMLLRVQPVAEPRPVSVFATTPQQAIHPAAPTLKTTAALGSRLEAEGQATPTPLERALPGALSLEPRAGVQRPSTPAQHHGPKVGRNEPCPCGSGLKYKKCHGK